MIQLRDNQVEPVRKAIEYFRKKGKGRPAVMVLPTAWGKSILAAYVAKECGEKIVVLQPSKELLEQNLEKYRLLCGPDAPEAAVYSASCGKKELADVTFATIGSIYKKGEEVKKAGIRCLLVDEAHAYPRSRDSMLGRFLDESGITKVLGITATPVRLRSERILLTQFSRLEMLTTSSEEGDIWRDILHVEQIGDMISVGYWSPLRYERLAFDTTNLRWNMQHSEYTEESISWTYESNDVHKKILTAIRQHKERKRIIVYVNRVDEAMALAKSCPKSAYISGEMNRKERAATVDLFRRGKIRVLFNVKVLVLGFDVPEVDCIILGRATASVTLYYQMVGRATRLVPKKKDALVIDVAGVSHRFGPVEDIRFEEFGGGWRMFGHGDMLMSDVPVNEIGRHTKEVMAAEPLYYAIEAAHDRKEGYTKEDEEILKDRRAGTVTVMMFGKYKGKKISEMPANAIEWYLKNVDWRKDQDKLRCALRHALRRKQSQPQQEDAAGPVTVMPWGQYRGYKIEDIPETYRRWLMTGFYWKKGQEAVYNAVAETFKLKNLDLAD